ncbi:MAG TPA: gluconate 2-dehydrogenase subunit 3 family protein [Vicinamibacterales bacterium]|nr:gluconate 2-dehydrogenase subunit 3 family protein [Vicinamibacterales bacterium]
MKVNRRDALRLLASAPLAAGFVWTEAEAHAAYDLAHLAQKATESGTPFKPKFFSSHEWETVRVLVDVIIPRDERSGSATDAGVPEFMDFMMSDQLERQTAMRGGLAWLDLECQKRFDKMLVTCSDTERAAVLDDIAWPQRAKREHRAGVAFFNSFRDLTATGFWTSKMGIDDLQYIGNRSVPQWRGCPEEALKKLGVRYPTE